MTDTTEQSLQTNAAPAALSAALRDRLLGAMQQAGAEERADRELELRLQRLAPAPLSARLSGRLGVQMCLRAVEERGRRKTAEYDRRLMWHRFAAAASVMLLAVAAPVVLFTGNASADTVQVLASRSVLEKQAVDVQWQGGTAVRSYIVTYEDEFVMEADDDMKVMVRVPCRTEVTVDEDVL